MTANKVLKIDDEAKDVIKKARDDLREKEGRKVTFSETVKKICSTSRRLKEFELEENEY